MIKVGILGTGFGKTHLELYKKIEGFEVVSIFGRNQETLDRIKEKYSVFTTTDANEIIKDNNIDLIDICLPTELHCYWAIEGLKNGKHIFCETPVSYSAGEAVTMQQTAAKYEKSIFVNLFINFSAPHQLAAELVKKAECGQLLSFRSYNRTSPRWGDLGLKKNVETFHNHMMDFAIRIAGMPNSVTASGINFNGKSSIVTSALIYDKMYALLESNSGLPECSPFEIGFELFCANGIIRFDAVYGDYTKEEFSIFKNGNLREIVKVDEKDDYEETIKHIRHCLNKGIKSEVINIENAADTVKLKEMILCSMRA